MRLGGWLATTIGAKWVYAASLSTSSLATLALTTMYLVSNTNFILILILRIIIGLAHGVLFPATIALWSLWAVPQERSTLASIGFCGTHLGTSLTMLTGGVLCRYFYAGWMYLFFVSSILGFIWFILWTTLTADSPNHHKTISDHERDYICKLTGSTGKKRAMSLASIPWKNIVTSKPLNALMVTHIANLFGLFFFLTNLGKILNQLLRLQAQHTGYILSFGFFLTLLSSLTSGKGTEIEMFFFYYRNIFLGIITDHLVRSNILTLTTARKLFNSLTSFVPALCMLSLYFCDHTRQILGVITVLVFLASSGKDLTCSSFIRMSIFV
jgi:MFS family permease